VELARRYVVRICPHCRARFKNDVERCPHDGSVLLGEPTENPAFVQPVPEYQRLQSIEAAQGRYTIMDKVGQGGWGGVYRAMQHSTQRIVALKILRKDVAEDPAAQRRFHQEARAVSSLKHPNTVTLFDFGKSPDGTLFMAMEYVEGQSVDKVISATGDLPPKRVARIARQVALSLSEAHEHGIIHRDIKPHNVMVTEMGGEKDFVKVLDFGVAKLLSNDVTLTSTGSTFGTPEYMSPEQVQSRDIDHRSDLYSLGIVIYEMLTGAPPFSGGSALTVALAHAHKKPPPIERDKEVPKPLRSLVKRLLAKDPNDRPPNAMAVAEELATIEAALAQTVESKPRKNPLVPPRLAAWAASNWTVVVSAAAVVLLLVAGLMLLKKQVLQGSAEQSRLVPPPDRSAAPVLVPPGGGTRDGQAPQPIEPGKEADQGKERPAWSPLSPPPPGGSPAVRVGGEEGVAGSPPPPGGSPAVRVGGEEGVAGLAPPPDRSAAPVLVPPGGGTRDGQAPQPMVPSMEADHGKERPSWSPLSSPPPGGSPAVRVGGEEGVAGSAHSARARFSVSIESSQPGVAVFRGGKQVCLTPCPLRVRKGERVAVELRKDGFLPVQRVLSFDKPGSVSIPLKPQSLSEADGLKGALPASVEDGLK